MPLPFRFLTRRAGPVGLALTAYDVWRRLPSDQRKQIIDGARKHGPRLAREAAERRRARRNTPPRP